MKKAAPVIGIDIGGTKVAAALISASGRVLLEARQPTQLVGGWPALKAQLVDICRNFEKESGLKASAVGIGSAGPLHAPSGTLLDPTNFGWKKGLKINLTKDLKAALKKPVYLENDAAAAVLAEHWKGKAGNNCVVITLGTGLGVGAICNGILQRGGRGLHSEAGHLLLRPGDETALCGCGNYGCAEAYLAGKKFEERAAQLLGEPGVKGIDLARRAKAKEPKVAALFLEYSELMAEFLQNMVVLYYPEKVIFMGSFAAAHSLFLPLAKKRLAELLARRLKTLPLMPEMSISSLEHSAVLGAGYLALHPRKA